LSECLRRCGIGRGRVVGLDLGRGDGQQLAGPRDGRGAAGLTDAQAQAALDPVLTAMKGATDRFTLEGVADALQALAPKLTDTGRRRRSTRC
jgi:hypothetical protein